jgi:hypothetical protein
VLGSTSAHPKSPSLLKRKVSAGRETSGEQVSLAQEEVKEQDFLNSRIFSEVCWQARLQMERAV